MKAARTSIGLWLVVQLLLGSLLGHAAPPQPGEAPVQATAVPLLWHGDATGQRDCADFVAERPLAKRAGNAPCDDALPGGSPAAPRPAHAHVLQSAAPALAHATPASTRYRARAPPRPA
ncbi:hypothetical protein [Pseudorhodoferax sp.]|uniref:hypothetical protein n=1 Tax=Pseudorhodoferax sp. TaxID=1993553 RepID=UPI002DD68AD6|nr:hypothetical protein [Pseudorhodoferax sp.]